MTFDQTHWVAVQRRQPLPTFYYHAHFVEMLEFVGQHYAHVLLDAHIEFIEEFRKLPTKAQCLYVRLVNRKGCIFSRRRLRYPELGELEPLLTALELGDWITAPRSGHFREVLEFLTRTEIYHVAMQLVPGIARSLRKADLVEFVVTHVDPDRFIAALNTRRIFVQRRTHAVRYLLFLYFGQVRNSLSKFAMRDLGIVKTQDFQDNYEPRFNDRVEASEHYYFATRLKQAGDAGPALLQQLGRESGEWPEPNFPGSAQLRDELAQLLGRKLERQSDPELAIACYRRGETAECSERLVRLYLALDRKDDALRFLERCLDNPRSDEELLIAQDIYARKFDRKRTTVATDVLRAADTLDIDESRSGAPERAVVEHFEGKGLSAYRTENLVWRTLFGLLFWDDLFAGDDVALHSPFEFLPSALSDGTFYSEQQQRVEKTLDFLRDPAAAKKKLLQTSTRHYGKPNGIFRWRESMNEAVFALIDNAPVDALVATMRRICQDYRNSRYGYPDLMVVESGGIRFIEVKAEGDQLRRNQLLRLQQLQEDGFRADVLRIRWVLDPDQAYVVVDVETTGGRGRNHRVTEIGAVKVRNGRIVDRFQTLLNPQRNIPANIVRLTGITPTMVEDAPYFVDIADTFEDFMEDSIFVAHNVEFDYGFIASEFARIGRPFRHPKLCTCASMRRLYPGQRSYSLASLCRRYDIPLDQHHRALCDAEAAAQLLLIINEKRQQKLQAA